MENTKQRGRQPSRGEAAHPPLEILIFEAEGITFGLAVEQVIEIIESVEICLSDELPDFVKGTIPFRGESVPVVDLAEWYQLINSKKSQVGPMIVVETSYGKLGICVDTIQSVENFSIDQIEPLPLLIKQNITVRSIWGMGKLEDDRVVMLMNLDGV